jgi:methionyl-tRNA synthetase
VWFDALLDISATKEWALREGKEWEPYWKIKTQAGSFIGKDNIVFTALFSLRC